MNNYTYPFIPNNNLNIIDELVKINETLKRIEQKLGKQQKITNNYLEKDDNYYMV